MTKICIELMNGKKMYFDLFEEEAPITVANFLHLVDINFFQGLIFHRVIKDFMSQGGGYYLDENNVLFEKSTGYAIPGEFRNNNFTNTLSHEPGVISMARTNDPNSAGSQFFICSNNARFLDSNYAAFGKVSDEESLQVAEELNSIDIQDIGRGLTDFPCGLTANFTIKSIYRVND